MLIGDVLGLPFIPWILAEPIGKAAAKFAAEIPAEKKKAKKAAKRRGADAEAVEAELLGRRVKLKLPTTAEISATVKARAIWSHEHAKHDQNACTNPTESLTHENSQRSPKASSGCSRWPYLPPA